MKHSLGMSMIEVIVSFGTAVVIVAGVTVAVLSALSNAQFSRNQKLATDYATEAIETVRHLRDSDYQAFAGLLEAPDGHHYCLDKGLPTLSLPNSTVGCNNIIDNIFVRQVDIDHNASKCDVTGAKATDVTVYVMWSDSKCKCTTGACSGMWALAAENGLNYYCHRTKLSTCLSDFQIPPTP